jgi:hypothetical protein
MPPLTTLTEADIEHFIRRGHVTLRGCFPKEQAEAWRERAWVRLGYDPNDPATWERPRVHLANLDAVRVAEFAPRAWGAICDLVGGADRIATPEKVIWGDGFIVNLNVKADEPWQPPDKQTWGWHKDGESFRHFLDSPEQGLLVIVVWSDIAPKSGGTFIACDSVPPVARLLREHPEGIEPTHPFGELVSECGDFEEVTGETGDVVLLHPYMLHAGSPNPSGRPRFITNPPIGLAEPMNFNRDDPAEFSPVERAVLAGLGVDRLDWHITGERGRVDSRGGRARAASVAAEKERLAAKGMG